MAKPAPPAAAASSAPPQFKPPPQPNLFGILGPYRKQVALLIALAVVGNALSLAIPALIARGIDDFNAGHFDIARALAEIGAIAIIVFFFTGCQSLLQTLVSETVARDLRSQLAGKIGNQSYRFVEDRSPATLLTNLTSDIDSVKTYVSMVIPTQVTSVVTIIGTAIILLTLYWQLALLVLLIIPLLGGTFFVIMRKMRPYFMQGRTVVDTLNRVIRENIVGAALVRVLDTGPGEHDKFAAANAQSRNLGLQIVKLFSLMVPIITFVSGMGTLTVVTVGGLHVINGGMSIGTFTAFSSYVALLIFPVMMMGFMTNIIAQATASYVRISAVLKAPDPVKRGTIVANLRGDIAVEGVNLNFDGKSVLKNVSMSIEAGTRTAILGPTAAGKTQLLNLLAGMTELQSGSIRYDGLAPAELDQQSFYSQLGLVFQDSVLFNTTLRENIAFSKEVEDAALQRAITTAELADFVAGLPQGLDTLVSERGTSLSGGQKQRIMLARALAQNPRILFLDDFTARVDAATEQKILANLARQYPDLTLVSITQKIAPVADYDQIVLLMEGEVLASGTHQHLMQSCPEYVQIHNSQRSTQSYELRT